MSAIELAIFARRREFEGGWKSSAIEASTLFKRIDSDRLGGPRLETACIKNINH